MPFCCRMSLSLSLDIAWTLQLRIRVKDVEIMVIMVKSNGTNIVCVSGLVPVPLRSRDAASNFPCSETLQTLQPRHLQPQIRG